MRKNIIIAGIAAAALALTACSAPASTQAVQTGGSSPTTLQIQTDPGKSTVTVSASGSVTAEPDMASVSLDIETAAGTIKEATQINSGAVAAVMDAVGSLGTASTASVSLYPEYDYQDGTTALIGYRMHTSVAVDDIKKDDVSIVLKSALEAGANSINGVRYYSSAYDEAYGEALKAAIESADAKAESIAEASGKKLGKRISVIEAAANNYARYASVNGYVDADGEEMPEAAGDAMGDVTMVPKDVAAEANITVTYELR